VGRFWRRLLLGLSALPGAAGASLVGQWSFEEGAGDVAVDVSGLGRHGAFVGSPSWSSGRFGGGLAFPAAGARVVVFDHPSLDFQGPLSLAAWVRPELRASQSLVKKSRTDVSDGFELNLSDDGRAYVRFNQASGGNAWKLFSTRLYPTDGQTWLHLAAVYDPPWIRLYVDGVLEASQLAPGLVVGANALPLSIGAGEDGSGPLRGRLDEVRVYSHALGAAEIAALLAAPPAQPDADGDGVPDAVDAFPADPGEWLDMDGDGAGNQTDADDDGDGIPDEWELWYGTSPFEPSDAGLDSDGDGETNLEEFEPRDFWVQRGTGCTSAYPSCGTQLAPFDDIDLCALEVQPGDTCWVLDGQYGRGIDQEDGSPYEPLNPGLPHHRISFRAAPGHRPEIATGPGVIWSFGTRARRDYVTYAGFRVNGVVRIRGNDEDERSVGVILEDLEICGGGGKDDGNWSGIFAEFVEDLTIRNSVIRDIRSPSGSGQKGISLFNGRRTLVEHNWIGFNQSEGVFDKEGGEDNTYRRNLFANNTVALKINNQTDERGVSNERTRIYENVFVCEEPGLDEAIRLLSRPTDWEIYNNTGAGCGAIVVRSSSGPAAGGVAYNNIWWADGSGKLMWESQNGDDREPDLLDWNLYSPDGSYRENRFTASDAQYDSLASWSAASHPLVYDRNSRAGDPLFVDPSDHDYHLAPGSPGRGTGRFSSPGAEQDLGAWPRRDDTRIGPPRGSAFSPDTDGDCVPDSMDDCSEVPDPEQIDADGDGYGNACDADYDNNGAIGASDFNRMRLGFGRAESDPLYDPSLDSQGDGIVGASDWNLLRSRIGSQQIGPSGRACAGTPEALSGAVPCTAQ
jgi:hypothetical protein